MQNDFVQYLFDRKLLSEAVATRVRDTSANTRIPIGRLLLEGGVLTMRQVMQVLALQGESPGLRFGELAIAQGFLDTAQLEAALRRQAIARKHQIEIVRELALFSEAELQGLTMDYIVYLELRAAEEHGIHAA